MILGIVPAGGAGRRMGGLDKARLEVGGMTLLDRVLTAARPVCDRLVVVGPARPTPVAGVEFVQEAAPGGGPVPAVAAGLGRAPEADVVLVVAADLPFVTDADLRRLVAAAPAAADHRGRPHPLLAAYEGDDLRARAADLGPGTPAARLVPDGVTVVDLGPTATLNVNSPADLAEAERLAGGPHGGPPAPANPPPRPTPSLGGMNDEDVLTRITALVEEEHRLESGHGEGKPITEEETERLRRVEVALDQCWDLLRQRRARRRAGLDPDDAEVRDPGMVEGYRQ